MPSTLFIIVYITADDFVFGHALTRWDFLVLLHYAIRLIELMQQVVKCRSQRCLNETHDELPIAHILVCAIVCNHTTPGSML